MTGRGDSGIAMNRGSSSRSSRGTKNSSDTSSGLGVGGGASSGAQQTTGVMTKPDRVG
ncbi:Uncharacterised protein [Mycobacteroides abscessus subsp. abscessus]|nr:Uncharacterised protein [Mycobacteroides abscessus subsp. abscessus]